MPDVIDSRTTLDWSDAVVLDWSDADPAGGSEAAKGDKIGLEPNPNIFLFEVEFNEDPESFEPEQLMNQYVATALRRVLVDVTEAGRFFLTIPILGDVWAEGSTEEEALAELGDVVRQWLLMKIEDHDRDLPVLGTLDLNSL